jgi:DNA-binding Lrp family transcriptional regulator
MKMAKNEKINEKEKRILNILGKNANLSYKDILAVVPYKREEIIAKKISKLRKMDILRGPYCDINLGAVGSNQIYTIYTHVGITPENRDLVFDILTQIPGTRWVFPTQQEDRFFTQIQCNHYSVIGRLLRMLKKKKLITYQMAASKNRWMKMNPDFFGPFIPDSKTLTSTCTLPDLSYSPVKAKIRWKKADLTFMQYLQVETDKKTKIRDIEYRRYGHFWTYGQIQNSIRKIESSGIIQSKDFHIAPYPRNKCCTFILQLHGVRKKPLITALHNFGRGCRIYKTYTVAGDTGILFCWAHPSLALEIIALFDDVRDITTQGLYYLRTHTGRYLYASSFEPDLFSVKIQKWEFPYLKVKKEIENLIEKRK